MTSVKDFPKAIGLSAERRELLGYLLEEEGIELPQTQTIPRIETSDELPLSFAQERLWFLDQLEPGNTAYNIPAAYRLRGPLDVVTLERSLNEIVRRHEILRTTFAVVDGRPVQVIAPEMRLTLPVEDLQELPEAEREAEAQRLLTEEAQRPFDLEKGPLLRAALLRLNEEEHVLLLTMHHIVSDGWSMGVFNRELSVLYEAFSAGEPSPLPELPIQYADSAVWQREWLQGGVLEEQLAYWREYLGDDLPVLELPTDRLCPAAQTFQGAHRSFVLSDELTGALRASSRREGVTLFMTLLAAFEVLLYRYTGQEDVIVGSPIAGCNRSEIEGLIGFFVNTLVLRTGLSGDPTFRELLGRVREVVLEAQAHQDLPFARLVEELQPERDLSHNPLFQVMFAFQNAPAESPSLSGLMVTPLEVESRTAQFDLTLSMEETGRGLKGVVEYNTDLFDEATIERMIGHFETLLEGIVADPSRRLWELPLLTEAERHQLLVEWNETKMEYPQDKCIHQLFEEQVERTPDAVAVVFEGEELTYRELNQRANRLAHYLWKLGVEPEVLVGICVERSLEMVVGLLGILRAGGAYVPLDPAYPKERLAFMLEDTQAPVLLTQERLVEGLPEHEARVVCLDADWEAISGESTENLASGVTVDNLAYVIYTSGLTSRPKGVAIAHRSTVVLLHWAEETFCAGDLAGVLASTSICFDLSVFELFAPLSWGGKVILVENALHLSSLAAIEDVTLVNTVPPAITELLRMDGSLPASVRTVNLAGEVLRTEVVQRIYEQETVRRVFDLYGPSEDTTYSTFALRSASGPYTIGRPIANTQVYLLDANLQPVPVGVPGELYIGGVGLARSYLNRPELTAESFIPHPFSDGSGARLYKTGDLARYLPDGNIEFLGRLDYQVKIRGFRIELGEIEAVLGQHPDVRETVVLAREDEPGDKRLVAYVVPRDEQVLGISDLRAFLKKLPNYMVPSAFVMLDALPLTPNGKVDRQVLLASDQARPKLQETFVSPRDTLELQLMRIWEEVLDTRPIGMKDNFFELGGHSLQAAQLITRIQQLFDRDLPLITLYQGGTIEHLGCVLRKQAELEPWSPLVRIQSGGSKRPFFGVHSISGTVMCYVDLARHVGTDQPFYGLQTLGVEGKQSPLTQIETMSINYVEALHRVQPEGPYLLGGYSFGGFVAFEMAQQLQAMGQEIALLVLFDTANTLEEWSVRMADNSSYWSWKLGDDLPLSLDIDYLGRLGPEQQLDYVLEQLSLAGELPHRLQYFELPKVRQLLKVERSNVQALANYKPKIYQGRITLFRARERPEDFSEDPELGWGELATGGVEVYEVPGDHRTMLYSPNVEVVAERLRDCILKAQVDDS